MTLESFHTTLGQIVMYCQIIEHDVKLIYATMQRGDVEQNYAALEREKLTLGQAVMRLEELDLSDGKAYLGSADYALLRDIARMRNHWCHDTFLEFIYDQNFYGSEAYRTECRHLSADRDKLAKLYVTIENARLQAMRDFRRI
ncbi:MAG: hypothetical protein IJT69_03760 [Clostridia bacterium]|nr:hypothetical protein [Clostridia bacterium]